MTFTPRMSQTGGAWGPTPSSRRLLPSRATKPQEPHRSRGDGPLSRESCSWVLNPRPLGLTGSRMAAGKQDIRDSKWQALGWKGKPSSRKRGVKSEALGPGRQSPLRCLSQQNTPRTTGCFLKAKGHCPGHDWHRGTQTPSSPTARAARGRVTAGPTPPPSQQDSAPKDSTPPTWGSPHCTFEGRHGFGGGIILKDRVS